VTSVPHVHRVRHRGSVEVNGAGPVAAHVGHALMEHGVEPGELWCTSQPSSWRCR
jgi:hypothetical protein